MLVCLRPDSAQPPAVRAANYPPMQPPKIGGNKSAQEAAVWQNLNIYVFGVPARMPAPPKEQKNLGRKWPEFEAPATQEQLNGRMANSKYKVYCPKVRHLDYDGRLVQGQCSR